MPKVERLKEDIGLIKFFVGACVTAIFASAGWIFVNYENTEFVRLMIAFANIVGSFIALVLLMKNISKKLDELERSKKDD